MRLILLALLSVFLHLFLVGCLSIPLDPIVKALDSPAIQATMKDWRANASVKNPRAEVKIFSGASIEFVGVDGEGSINGGQNGGIDPVLYEKLLRLIKEYKATSQPTSELFDDVLRSRNLFLFWRTRALKEA